MNDIVNGDCRDLMKTIGDKKVDLILTDPPYGIGLEYDIYEDTIENWKELMTEALPEIIRISKMAILPCSQIKLLPWIYKKFPPDWLISWYKGSLGHNSFIGFNDWEPLLVYGRLPKVTMHDYIQTKASPKKGTDNHPCPKPIEWALEILKAVRGKHHKHITVFDPFVGSGTVLLAAKLLGLTFFGCDISPKYVEVARAKVLGVTGGAELKKGFLF